jgi:hypothetical protein|tara:strand:- start:699 stop:881 length:183 start_codon:yes stop_codon:yes gene_type:complete
MNIWQTIKSILAAMLGVQSSANRERDFESGNLVIFITAGLVTTVMFMLTLFLFVDQIVLR